MKVIKKKTMSAIAVVLTAFTMCAPGLLTSCNDTSKIGSTLVSDEITIVVDSSFTVSARSIESGAVLSRTVMELLGIIDAPEYGFIKSDFVTQFMPAIELDTTYVKASTIDSLRLVMLVDDGYFTGDSLALMGLEVYPLTKQLEAPIYSNFDPTGYYDPTNKIGSMVYNLTRASVPDSLQDLPYYSLSVGLPREMGQQLFELYVKNPALYASPSEFAKYFPGLYVKNSYGSGRIIRIGNTTMQMFYHKNYVNSKGNDTTTYHSSNYYAVTPEVVTNNNIDLTMAPEVKNRVSAGQALLLAPAGLEVEIAFPGKEIVSAYKNGTKNGLGVVNTLSFELPIENIDNYYDITAPEEVLLILKNKRDDFFLNNELPDGKTSFSTVLGTLSNGSKGYSFADMRKYILDLIDKESISDEDVTFMLVPVTVTSEQSNDYYGGVSSTMTAITPYVTEPKMGRILPEKAKINFVYSLQTTNF